jgi:hypothetical protein
MAGIIKAFTGCASTPAARLNVSNNVPLLFLHQYTYSTNIEVLRPFR